MNIITQDLPEEFSTIIEEHVPDVYDFLESYGGSVYLAGGFLRTLVSEDEVLDPKTTDVDLFFRDGDTMLELRNQIEKFHPEWYKVYQCPEDKLTTYVWLNGEEPKWKLQLVSVDYYPSLESLIDSFDFTVTMFSTDLVKFAFGETSIKDTMEKHLVWNKITYPASSIRRMMKYSRKGYWMREDDYQKFVSDVWEHASSIKDEALVYVD